MKTDLSKILSVSGVHGLHKFIAQSRSGAIAESLETAKRTNFDRNSRITSLEDISIYTSEGEVKLRKVFESLREVLADADAPSPKASPEEFKALFAKALPNYDEDRFYVSHMKKVAEWYNCLKKFASLEFEDPDAEQEAPAEQ